MLIKYTLTLKNMNASSSLESINCLFSFHFKDENETCLEIEGIVHDIGENVKKTIKKIDRILSEYKIFISRNNIKYEDLNNPIIVDYSCALEIKNNLNRKIELINDFCCSRLKFEDFFASIEKISNVNEIVKNLDLIESNKVPSEFFSLHKKIPKIVNSHLRVFSYFLSEIKDFLHEIKSDRKLKKIKKSKIELFIEKLEVKLAGCGNKLIRIKSFLEACGISINEVEIKIGDKKIKLLDLIGIEGIPKKEIKEIKLDLDFFDFSKKNKEKIKKKTIEVCNKIKKYDYFVDCFVDVIKKTIKNKIEKSYSDYSEIVERGLQLVDKIGILPEDVGLSTRDGEKITLLELSNERTLLKKEMYLLKEKTEISLDKLLSGKKLDMETFKEEEFYSSLSAYFSLIDRNIETLGSLPKLVIGVIKKLLNRYKTRVEYIDAAIKLDQNIIAKKGQWARNTPLKLVNQKELDKIKERNAYMISLANNVKHLESEDFNALLAYLIEVKPIFKDLDKDVGEIIHNIVHSLEGYLNSVKKLNLDFISRFIKYGNEYVKEVEQYVTRNSNYFISWLARIHQGDIGELKTVFDEIAHHHKLLCNKANGLMSEKKISNSELSAWHQSYKAPL